MVFLIMLNGQLKLSNLLKLPMIRCTYIVGLAFVLRVKVNQAVIKFLVQTAEKRDPFQVAA